MNYERLIDNSYRQLPAGVQRAPWSILDHGRKVLQTEEELDAYLAAYGEMHIVKCRAALQNFPFDKLKVTQGGITHHFPYEIYDWGCGQGLATCVLLDMLKERELLSNLRRIYLIEPSAKALERAKCLAEQLVGTRVNVVAVNKYIPDNEEAVMPEVSCSSPVSICLFSNILDVAGLSLSWLANKTASLADTNYMVCVGPKYSDFSNTRICDFCGYFNPSEYFSSIDMPCFGYTSRTQHVFGCQTRCFTHERGTSLVADYKECAKDFGNDEYFDYTTECLRGSADDETISFYNALRENAGASYEVFYKPNINCDTADILVIGQNKGIILINVCNKLSELEAAAKRVETVKQMFFNIHLKNLIVDSILNRRVYGCIQTGLFFPKTTSAEVEQAIKDSLASKHDTKKDNYQYLLRFTSETNIRNIFGTRNLNIFKKEYYDELKKIIAPAWHSYREGNQDFKLTPRQEDIVMNTKDRLRVRGVAGCGKTQVVAHRAVYRHLLTGDRVLIITFNITLVQYIRWRISEIPADFSANMFEVTNYHQFFRSMANRYAPHEILDLASWDKPNFFSGCTGIERYKTIIIDEVQDFKREWLTLIINSFLAADGSIFLFGDGEQNIYKREYETETRMPVTPTIIGRWNEMNERISMRVLNPYITVLASNFAKKFINPDFDTLRPTQLSLADEPLRTKYWLVDKNLGADELTKDILWIMQRYSLETKDTVILGQSINLLRDIDASYRKQTRAKTMTTFETAEVYQDIYGQNSLSSVMQVTLMNIRRVAKTHFTTDCDELKFSTIHSFKGWEAKNIILFLQPEREENEKLEGYYIAPEENTPPLVYTALTRARNSLFIINIGNETYHHFFKQSI